MVAIVLMGAGASFGSGDARPTAPPLGGALFAKLEALGGVASRLDADLKAEFHKDFETGMKAFYERSEGDVMAFQRELAGYFAQFSPGITNTYGSLIRALGVRRVLYASLNYDLLFELAAAHEGHSTIHYGSDGPSNVPRLLKLHGSCNFWPDLMGNTFHNCTFAGGLVADVEAPIKPLDQRATLQRARTDTSFAPAIAMYAVGKAIKVSPSYVERQLAQFHAALKTSSKVFIVGVRVHRVDDHIWGALGCSKAQVTYFGFDSDLAAFEDWKQASGHRRAFFVRAPFEESVLQIRDLLFR